MMVSAKRRFVVAVSVVAVVYCVVLIANPDLPLVHPAWEPLLSVLTWPGSWVAAFLVWMGIAGLHADLDVLTWLTSALFYFLVLYVALWIGNRLVRPAKTG